MNKKFKNILTTVVFSVILFGVSAVCAFKPADAYSLSERRELAQLPQLDAERIFSGDFSADFEAYTRDQFPFRDRLRRIKAFISYDILNKKDNNGIFVADGHLSKTDAEENEAMMDYAAEKFGYLYNTYLKDNNTKVYFSIVPDKNYYIAEKNGYPSLSYESFISKMREKTDYMEYIDITGLLSADDYYKTDTHWKQERITDIAAEIASRMGTGLDAEYTENSVGTPFSGVYAGQYALGFPADEIKYLTNSITDAASVDYYDTGMPERGEIYNMEKAAGKDPYEMFLSGSTPLAVIESPLAETDKELIIFRDSFGSSLAPLFAEGYKKITVIDIRYVQSSFLGGLVDFADSDVLFIYSTALLNNSLAMK